MFSFKIVNNILNILWFKAFKIGVNLSILAQIPIQHMAVETRYDEDNIRSLDWKEHIRMRPGMYIGKLGDGSSPDDGIYILIIFFKKT